jgi:hypothetical protein
MRLIKFKFIHSSITFLVVFSIFPCLIQWCFTMGVKFIHKGKAIGGKIAFIIMS